MQTLIFQILTWTKNAMKCVHHTIRTSLFRPGLFLLRTHRILVIWLNARYLPIPRNSWFERSPKAYGEVTPPRVVLNTEFEIPFSDSPWALCTTHFTWFRLNWIKFQLPKTLFHVPSLTLMNVQSIKKTGRIYALSCITSLGGKHRGLAGSVAVLIAESLLMMN